MLNQVDDLSRSRVALDQESTLIAVIELSLTSWLVSGLVPGLSRQPLKKLGADPEAVVALLHRWREEAQRAGTAIQRIAVGFEAGRNGSWLARWLRARGIEAYIIHPTSIPVSREHRRAKTDRLDTQLLLRALVGWLRGEPKHCQMCAIPTLEEEDARRPNREHQVLAQEKTRIVNRIKGALVRLGIAAFNPQLRQAQQKLEAARTPEGMPIPPNALAEMKRDLARLELLKSQLTQIEQARKAWLEATPSGSPQLVRILAQVKGIGIETADMLVHEVMTRPLRDRRAVARFAGLTGSPDESGSRRREKGLSKAGVARVRRGMVQLAWRFLMFQKQSGLAQWWRTQVEGGRGKKTMIVALARKLLIALWRLTSTGLVPEDWVLHASA